MSIVGHKVILKGNLLRIYNDKNEIIYVTKSTYLCYKGFNIFEFNLDFKQDLFRNHNIDIRHLYGPIVTPWYRTEEGRTEFLCIIAVMIIFVLGIFIGQVDYKHQIQYLINHPSKQSTNCFIDGICFDPVIPNKTIELVELYDHVTNVNLTPYMLNHKLLTVEQKSILTQVSYIEKQIISATEHINNVSLYYRPHETAYILFNEMDVHFYITIQSVWREFGISIKQNTSLITSYYNTFLSTTYDYKVQNKLEILHHEKHKARRMIENYVVFELEKLLPKSMICRIIQRMELDYYADLYSNLDYENNDMKQRRDKLFVLLKDQFLSTIPIEYQTCHSKLSEHEAEVIYNPCDSRTVVCQEAKQNFNEYYQDYD